MNEVAEGFRRILEVSLEQLPQETALGRIVGTDVLGFGAPSGSHSEAPFWRFESSSGLLSFHFGFVPNFTPNDLMCKVSPAGVVPARGAGASIQLNANESFRGLPGGEVEVRHHGRVTVGHSISRVDLLARMNEVAPEVIRHFGGVDERRWPLPLGTTTDLPSLVDNLFVWSFGVEQVKLSLREQDLLLGLQLP